MSQRLDLRNLDSLNDLKAALRRFSSAAHEGLRAADVEINRTLEWLHDRVTHWQREVEQARREVARAEAILRRCEARGFRDERGYYHQPDCSREARALQRAEEQLRECQDNLQSARAWRSDVEQAINEYRRQAQRLSDLANDHTEKAQAFLGRAEAKYREVQAAAGLVASVGVLSGDAALLRKMDEGLADLSRKTEWGKFAHRAYEEAAEAAFPSEARSEVIVQVTKPDGSIGVGRIDTLLGRMIVDYKTHDLDHPSEAALMRELEKIAAQLHGYRASPDVPSDTSLSVLFEFPPSDPARRSLVESFFAKHAIDLIWGSD